MKGTVIWIKGDDPDLNRRVLEILSEELSGRGGRIEVFRDEFEQNLGITGHMSRKVHACCVLARNGITVLVADAADPTEIEEASGFQVVNAKDMEVSESMDGMLRNLELKGSIAPPSSDMDPEEESEIIKKLEEMGYL